jgi:hypothetical protein
MVTLPGLNVSTPAAGDLGVTKQDPAPASLFSCFGMQSRHRGFTTCYWCMCWRLSWRTERFEDSSAWPTHVFVRRNCSTESCFSQANIELALDAFSKARNMNCVSTALSNGIGYSNFAHSFRVPWASTAIPQLHFALTQTKPFVAASG